MKKVIALVCCIVIMLFTALPAHAAEVVINDGGTDGDGDIIIAEMPEQQTPPAGTALIPIDVKRETLGATPYLTRTYELDTNSVMDGLSMGFEQDGYLFTRCEVFEQCVPDSIKTKTVDQTQTSEAEDSSRAAFIASLPPTTAYSEDGYSGTLYLAAASVTVEESGTTSYRYNVSDVREYNALDRNDASYIAKTVTKNGVTLQLESVDWVVMATTPVDDALVPSLYKAVATYTGTATGTKVSGYLASYTYTGTVECVTPGHRLVSIVFRGEPIPPQPVEDETGFSFPSPVVCILTIACVLLAIYEGVLIVRFIRKRRGISQKIQ